MNFYFSTNDYLIILAYFVAILIIGFKTKKSESTVKDYILAGRTLTLPAFVATLVSSFYGGVLGIGEFTYSFGISGWMLYAFPYYFFILIFAFFLAEKIRKVHLYTIPDKLDKVYGKKVSILGGIFLFFLSTPAPYVFMMGMIIQMIFKLNILYSMIAALALSILYLLKGGLRADVRVNIFEFVLMFVGFGIILPFCFNKLGGFEYLESRLPASDLSFLGNISLDYFFVWFFMGAWVLIDPVFYQRCYAAKTKKIPRRGILISLVFWMIFDFMTTTAGLYAKAFLGKDIENPLYAFPVFANQILPSIAKSVFFLGIIATIMSSLQSYIFISATTFGRDVLSRIRNDDSESFKFSKTGLLISACLSLAIAYFIPSVVSIWYTIGTLIVPPLLISVVSSYFSRLQVHSKYIFAAMITSFSISLFSFIVGTLYKIDGKSQNLFGMEPMYPGLIAGLIIYAIGYSQRKNLVVDTDY